MFTVSIYPEKALCESLRSDKHVECVFFLISKARVSLIAYINVLILLLNEKYCSRAPLVVKQKTNQNSFSLVKVNKVLCQQKVHI